MADIHPGPLSQIVSRETAPLQDKPFFAVWKYVEMFVRNMVGYVCPRRRPRLRVIRIRKWRISAAFDPIRPGPGPGTRRLRTAAREPPDGGPGAPGADPDVGPGADPDGGPGAPGAPGAGAPGAGADPDVGPGADPQGEGARLGLFAPGRKRRAAGKEKPPADRSAGGRGTCP